MEPNEEPILPSAPPIEYDYRPPQYILVDHQNHPKKSTKRWILYLIVILIFVLLIASNIALYFHYHYTLPTVVQYLQGDTTIVDELEIDEEPVKPNVCLDSCRLQLVESIPERMEFKSGPKFQSTFHAFASLISLATSKINIASFYWTLRSSEVYNHSSSWQGEKIFQELLTAGKSRKIDITIAQNLPSAVSPNTDTKILMEQGAAKVRSLNFTRLLGGGVLHTKFWVVDDKHFYIGSANMDWRSLTQVKELGIFAQNCSCLATDINKIFDIYWELGKDNSKIPDEWPKKYSTTINYLNPMLITDGKSSMYSFISSSPKPLSATGRTDDLHAILHIILNAKKFVHISVMDFEPLLVFSKNIQYWGHIDVALRTAAVDNKVSVKLLISYWEHSRPAEDYFLDSIAAIHQSLQGVNVQVKRFIVPAPDDLKKIPFGRVNHNKYMVTDETAYIGTSNWSGDYFTDTAGVGFIANNSDSAIRKDLESIFKRDWNSEFAIDQKDYKKILNGAESLKSHYMLLITIMLVLKFL